MFEMGLPFGFESEEAFRKNLSHQVSKFGTWCWKKANVGYNIQKSRIESEKNIQNTQELRWVYLRL